MGSVHLPSTTLGEGLAASTLAWGLALRLDRVRLLGGDLAGCNGCHIDGHASAPARYHRGIHLLLVDLPPEIQEVVGYLRDRLRHVGSRVATVAVGYGDGYPRSAFKSATARIRGREVPVIGRVSMDLITLDVTALPQSELRVGGYADLLGPDFTADDLGRAAGTIGYEVLTHLGHRYSRIYSGA